MVPAMHREHFRKWKPTDSTHLRNLSTHQLTTKKLNRDLCDDTQETVQIPQNLFRKGSKQSKLITIILIGEYSF